MSSEITTAASKFWRRVEKTPGCWLWRGSVGHWGYGQWQPSRGKNLRAHRVAWEHPHRREGQAGVSHMRPR